MRERTLTREPVPVLDRVAPDVARLLPRASWDALTLAVASVLAVLVGLTDMWNLFRLIADPVSPWWSLAFALPGCVLVALRRRIPMIALVGGAVLFAADLVTSGGLGSLLVLMDVLWHAVHTGSVRQRRVIGVAIVPASALAFAAALARTDDLRVAVLIGLTFAALLGTDYWWAVAVGRAEDVAQLEGRRARDRAHDIIRDDRELMARELHDVVAGHVSAIAIRAEAALSVAPDESRDRQSLQAVRDASLQAHEALRSMISVLRAADGTTVVTVPRADDLNQLVRDAREAGLRVRLSSSAPLVESPEARQLVTDVVREALSNCMRHAPGADVEVVIADSAGVVDVRVDSHGGGRVSALAGSGTGLDALRARLQRFGGTLQAGPEGEGWSVRATIPRGAA